jgi:hypothetical protein
MAFKTEYKFTLPIGFVDAEGNVHKEGVMRLARARDEVAPLHDYRVQANRAYLVIVLLSRVVTKLGDLNMVTVETIENLFSTDLAFLQEFYRKVNEVGGAPMHQVTCPKCEHQMNVDMVTGVVVAEDGGAGRQGQG